VLRSLRHFGADPFEAPQEPMFKLHDAMEIKLGMNKI
jgi:hypothetical protein